MKQRALGKLVGLVGVMVLAGCAAEYADYTEGDDATFGTAQEAVSACEGDSAQYDYNAYAAALAIASAKDFGEWDAANNFAVVSGKLSLSSAANTFCGTGCSSTKDVLMLQEDSTAVIENHSPLELRSHLASWHGKNMTRLTELATESKLPPGSYQLRIKNSGKNMVVDASSTAENAVVEQGPLAGSAGNWVASVVGTKHKFQNVNSGKCLDLASASSADNVGVVQKTCSATSATQQFEVVKQDNGLYALKTTYGRQIVAYNWGTGNDVKMVQVGYQPSNSHGSFTVNPVGGTSNPANTIFKGMYKLNFSSTPSLVAAPVSAAEGAQVKQATYSASNRLHNWLATVVNGKYQFVNRGSGKCLALASDSNTALLVQKTCAVHDSQLFTPTALSYAQQFTLKTRYNRILEVQNAQSTAGTAIAQSASTAADPHRRVVFSPIMAAEPHKLTFDHISNDGPCGDYYWYNITQPSGAPVADAMNTYIDLIFVGGKTTYNGADENPFIAQLASGDQVAVDPGGLVIGGGSGVTGSCTIADIYTDPTKTAGGTCCQKYTGVQSTFVKSPWSTTTFLCK